MGSVGPLGVLTPSGLPRDGRARRIAPPRALRVPCASLQRPVAAPPHRPGPPKRSSTDDASFPGLSCPTTHARTTVRALEASSPEASRARFGTSCATMTAVPAETPFGAPSVLGLHPSRLSPRTGRTPSREPLPSCRFPRRFASPLKERADAVGFRASIPATSSFRPRHPCGRRASMPSWGSSLQSVRPLRPAGALIAPAPSSRVGRERRPVPPASRGLPARRDRLAPLGAAGSPGICHLATVAAP